MTPSAAWAPTMRRSPKFWALSAIMACEPSQLSTKSVSENNKNKEKSLRGYNLPLTAPIIVATVYVCA